MEIFEVLYKKQKVKAIKTEHGDIYIGLPKRRR